MRRSATRSIGEVLGDFVRQNDFELKLKEVEVVEHWHEMMGAAMGNYTRKISISRGILHVEISSPVVKAELIMNREELRRRLNERAGMELVRQIIFR